MRDSNWHTINGDSGFSSGYARRDTSGGDDSDECGLMPAETWSAKDGHDDPSGAASRLKLVAEIERFLTDYVVFENPACGFVVALWILGTHTWRARGVPCPFRAFAYLLVTSRFKGSGKSTLLALLLLVCRDPELLTSPTGAAIFRMIGSRRPTLLCDQQEQLSGPSMTVLNEVLLTGYMRDAVVPRVVNKVVVRYPTGCPKACALVGDLNDTLRDRCIIVRMQRAVPPRDLDASYEIAEQDGYRLRARAIASVATAMEEIEAAVMDSVESPFKFREKQIWRPIFVLCAVFCPSRASELMRVAADLSAEKRTGRRYQASQLKEFEDQADQEMWGRWLLEDMIGVMKVRQREKMETAEMLKALFDLDEGPWRRFGGPDELDGNGLNSEKMARLIRPFGVGPRRFWFGPKESGNQKHGYSLSELEDALRRNPSPRHP